MSRLQELIEQHCPDGVEYKTLKQVTRKIADGSHNVPPVSDELDAKRMISAKNINNGRIDFSFGRLVSAKDYETESKRTNALKGDVVLTIVGALGRTAVIETDETLAFQRSVCVMTPEADLIDSYFLSHALQTQSIQDYINANAKGAAQKGFYLKQVEALCIPVPPIEVQREIVRLLDAYTAAHDALVQRLNEELEQNDMRFLALCDSMICVEGAERKRLCDLGKLERGKRFTAADYVDDGVGCIHYGEVYTDYGYSATSALSHISREKSKGMRFAHKGDVIIACTGENKEDICKPVAWLGDEDVAVHDDCQIFRHGINGKFVSYALLTSEFRRQKARAATESKVVRVSGSKLSKMTIPVPSGKAQEAIVDHLDAAIKLRDRLCAEITRELFLREAQLAEFRNKLLTFPEKAA